MDVCTYEHMNVWMNICIDGATASKVYSSALDFAFVIVCPWHGYEYNVRDGRHPGNKNIRLRPFKVEVKDGEVYVVI